MVSNRKPRRIICSGLRKPSAEKGRMLGVCSYRRGFFRLCIRTATTTTLDMPIERGRSAAKSRQIGVNRVEGRPGHGRTLASLTQSGSAPCPKQATGDRHTAQPSRRHPLKVPTLRPLPHAQTLAQCRGTTELGCIGPRAAKTATAVVCPKTLGCLTNLRASSPLWPNPADCGHRATGNFLRQQGSLGFADAVVC